jgi:putative endonuclease
MTRKRQSLGRRGEDLACRFLEEKGYHIIARNYRTRTGEVDIIARDGAALVFVEVKTRGSKRFGHPFEAVTFRKRQQLTRVALEYISRNAHYDQEARFDVVGIITEGGDKIELIRNAFDIS